MSNHLTRIIGNTLGPIDAPAHHAEDPPRIPASYQALSSALLNPANTCGGSAVYTQEALDQIISAFMEDDPTTNAPGPASPNAVAALPKKNISMRIP
jgi:E3 ubiquitin-protein ligase RNF115/126